jgi:helicase
MNIEQEVKSANAFDSFNPMQKKVLEKQWKEKSIIVSSPTASGKTVVAELLALNSIINKKKKVVYSCPLRALASEHYSEFKKKYSKLKIRAGISTGDFDSKSSYLQNYDIIFTTYEKIDSLTRHKADWLSGIGLLIIDEIHSIGSDRGPTIEMFTAKLFQLNSSLQLLGLSATIPNAKELAEWVHAELVESDYRPVKLLEGVYFNGLLDFGSCSEEIAEGTEQVFSIVSDTLEKKKQALVFANTRKRSESLAKKLSFVVKKSLSVSEKTVLEKESQKILNVLERPTEQCKSLANSVSCGAAFHNAGLMQKQREIVEELFRANKIKVVSATPTLAMGINLPAFRVIIPSIYRYTSFGNQRIPVGEYKQWAGRAGRPRYDSAGQSIFLAKSEVEKEEFFEYYINGEIEEITSNLGIEPILRTHVLASIATGFAFDLASLEEFFSKTFYAKQYQNLSSLFAKISEILEELQEMGFIESNEKRISATLLGARVSELYLDPVSAHSMVVSLKKNLKNELALLFMISSVSEFYPLVRVRKKQEPEVWEKLQNEKQNLAIDVDREMFSDADLLHKFQTSLMLKQWINEASEESIIQDFNVLPGILHAKLQRADWLVYAAFELSRLLKLDGNLVQLNKLRKRLKSGIKEELVMLCEVRGIGRVRARKLWNANIRSIAELKKTDVKDIGRILSPKVAEKIKAQFKIA